MYSVDGQFGAETDEGAWTGMVGMLERRVSIPFTEPSL